MDPNVEMYLTQGFHGLAYGMLLFLVSSGLTLIFSMMGILNLAHASFYMLGAYFCYMVMNVTGSFWLALVIAPIITAFLGALAERYLLRNVHAEGHIAELILTLGISLVILEAVKIFWGTETLVTSIPHSLQGLVSIVGIRYPLYRLFIIGLSIIVLLILLLILYKSRLGIIVQAAVSDAEMANALGINVPMVFMFMFGIGIWLAGLSGAVAAPLLSVYPGMADQMALDAFIVVIVGGIGSIFGALIVALALGQLHSFGIQFVPGLAPILMFAFMVIVLAFKPEGLLGEKA